MPETRIFPSNFITCRTILQPNILIVSAGTYLTINCHHCLQVDEFWSEVKPPDGLHSHITHIR